MNRLYYEIAIKEAYDQGKKENEQKLNLVLKFLQDHKDKNNYISKKIRLLLEDLNKQL